MVMDEDLRDGNLLFMVVDIIILWVRYVKICTIFKLIGHFHSCTKKSRYYESPSIFYFSLDGIKIRSRHERELMCGKCASLHVLELVASL